ncbi:MAG TPA: hypothetical protein IAB46_03835 [Candidatus Scybalocola faecigallinarum]|uniref:Uroporphyrinogen decarboxylase (URO-D) domain-containing protein n=1 Tax=Candidatus Scybalocola faecigallinarum TaxID=2840941 RepID=A0A9D1F2Y2_9FIRM|nr:hypothetical protein [Candidatus Scybalocola faecigallinarum]
MNKKERVWAAFHNEVTDHVPCCFWRHYSPEMERGEDVVEAHLKFYRETDVDLLKISSDGYFGWPEVTLKNLGSARELYGMQHIGSNHPFIREQVARAKAIVDQVKDECMTVYTLFCPLSIFRLQVGWDKMMECMREDPKAVMHACDIIADDEIALIRALIQEAGVDGIFYSVQNAEVTRFTVEEYRQWVEPSDRKVLDFTNSISDCNVLHCCGWDADEAHTHNHLESWKDYPSAVVSWAAYVDHMDVCQIREFFNGRPAWGGYDNRVCGMLYTGTEAEIKAEAKRLIGQGTKKGFMLGPDCSLPNDIDNQRIRWVVEAARSI